jgi:tRNA U34 5-carboxymethylaminomethyl modifying enzyme MnmG/GidA
MVLRGNNSYSARVTDTALGTIRSLEATVQGFEERAERLALDITDANKRVRELGEKVGAKFEREDRFQELTRRQSEIEEKLDLTKNQASSQVDATSDETQEKAVETQSESMRHTKRSAVRV